MKTKTLTLIMAGAATALTAIPATAQQRSRNSDTTVTTARGTSTVDRQIDRAHGSVTRSATATGPRGNTTVRQGSSNYDRDTGFERQGTTTGPNGRAITSQGSASCENRTCTRSTSTTGPAGRTRSVDGSASQVAPGEFQGQRSVTTPRGTTRGSQRWVRIQRPR